MVMYGGDTTEERRQAIEARMPASRLVQYFDDDGDGAVEGDDLGKLEQTMGDADDVVTGILLNKGFNEERLGQLRTDRQIVRCWVNIFQQLAGERKPEWIDDDGLGPFDALGVRGRAELGKLARGEIRSVLEPTVGANTSLVGEVEQHTPFYAPDPRDPTGRGPGGF